MKDDPSSSELLRRHYEAGPKGNEPVPERVLALLEFAAAAEARLRMVAGGADELGFCAGLAARCGARRRGDARHFDRTFEFRHAHRDRSRSRARRIRRRCEHQCLRLDSVTGISPMTMTMTMPDRSSRWLLIGSLALNLFFIGTIGALAVRHYVMAPRSRPRPNGRAPRRRASNVSPRRCLRRMPKSCARRSGAREAAAEGARDTLNSASNELQARCARSRSIPHSFAPRSPRCARRGPLYEQVMQEILSGRRDRDVAGRAARKLADWPPPRPAKRTATL